jgi:hypothetical protein
MYPGALMFTLSVTPTLVVLTRMGSRSSGLSVSSEY